MILVDRPTWPAHDRLWSHLVSDTSFDELHAFAAGLGLPRRAFHNDHYDLISDRFGDALTAGARLVTSREIVTRLAAAGLRRRRRSRLAAQD